MHPALITLPTVTTLRKHLQSRRRTRHGAVLCRAACLVTPQRHRFSHRLTNGSPAERQGLARPALSRLRCVVRAVERRLACPPGEPLRYRSCGQRRRFDSVGEREPTMGFRVGIEHTYRLSRLRQVVQQGLAEARVVGPDEDDCHMTIIPVPTPPSYCILC